MSWTSRGFEMCWTFSCGRMWRLENLHKLKTEQMVKNNHFEILEWTKGDKIEKHWLMKNSQNLGKKGGQAAFLGWGHLYPPLTEGGWDSSFTSGWSWLSKPAATDLIGEEGKSPQPAMMPEKWANLWKQMRLWALGAWLQLWLGCVNDQWARHNIQPGDLEWENHSWLRAERPKLATRAQLTELVSLPRMDKHTREMQEGGVEDCRGSPERAYASKSALQPQA